MTVATIDDLAGARLARLRRVMLDHDVTAVLTADPINIVYATGVRNMTIFSMMGAARFAFVTAEGICVLWEFGGSEHLAEGAPAVDEVRTAPGVTAHAGPAHIAAADRFAIEVRDLCRTNGIERLAVERFDQPVTDALRRTGLEIDSATGVFVASRMIKLPGEIAVIRESVAAVERAVALMRTEIAPGATEIDVWSHFHRELIAGGGEYVSTRLLQAGDRTFPYFHEAGQHRLRAGDLLAIDTDAIALGGYGVDLSRTYLCGSEPPTRRQRELHALALDQLRHNADLLAPGRSFAEFAAAAITSPEPFAPFGYPSLAHGLGMSGEFPYVPAPRVGRPPDGRFEPGMVMCVESYIGDPESRQGVKLEDQYLITDDGAERLTTAPFDERLIA